jgi:hypothetical protein
VKNKEERSQAADSTEKGDFKMNCYFPKKCVYHCCTKATLVLWKKISLYHQELSTVPEMLSNM